jgi:hypothetical protein
VLCLQTEHMSDEGCWLHCLNLASVLLEGTPLKTLRPVAGNAALCCLADISRQLVMPSMEMGSAVRCRPLCLLFQL